MRLRPDSPIVELGAGTSKFTRVLTKRSSNVIAIGEFERVLRDGGGLGLIWNLDGVFTSNWGKIIDSWLDEIEGETPQYKTGSWRKVLEASDVFSSLNEQSFSSNRKTTITEVVLRIMSISFVASLEDTARTEIQQRVEELLANHPETRGRQELTVTFDTKIYWCHKK